MGTRRRSTPFTKPLVGLMTVLVVVIGVLTAGHGNSPVDRLLRAARD